MTVQTVWGHLVLLGLSIVMLGLSYPRPGMWILGFVALVPWGYVCVRSEKWWRLCWTSFVMFCAFWLIRVDWVVPVTVAGYIALSVIQAAYVALGSVLLWMVARKTRMLMVVALPLIWVAMEFLRCHYPAGGFGWFALGYIVGSYKVGQGPGVLAQFANMFGVWGVSFLLAMTSGLIVDLMTQKVLHMKRNGAKTVRKTVRGALVIWLIAYGSAITHGLISIGQYEQMIEGGDGEALSGVAVGVVQTNVTMKNTEPRDYESQAEDWHQLKDLTRMVSRESVDGERVQLVVWPETMVPGKGLNEEAKEFFRQYLMSFQPDELSYEIGTLARDYAVNIFAGGQFGADWEERKYGANVYPYANHKANVAYLYYADGMQSPLQYHKMKLVPVGEYWPWIGNWPEVKAWVIDKISPWGDYTLQAGPRPVVFDVPVLYSTETEQGVVDNAVNVRVVTPICYEDVVPRQVRSMVYDGGKKRADLIVNLTNSGWYSGKSMRPQHLQIATFRSIENGVPTARSVNTGESGFINALGQVTKLVTRNGQNQYQAGVAAEFVRFDERTTLYGRIGDMGAWVVVGLVSLMTIICLLGREKKI
ncbi:apolipoprotein N-acyltransferase [Planctomycetota bacterium]|nr:apolipoprotein N-acyltransferase [Planctomycetota bacterium]